METSKTQRVVIDVEYVAFDGTKFKFKEDCEKYERENSILKTVYDSEIKQVQLFNDRLFRLSEIKNMYYFSNENEYFLFLKKNNIEKPFKNFDKFYPGWFIVISEWDGDYRWFFFNYEKYKIQQQNLLNEWIIKTNSIVLDKENESKK